MPIRFRCEKCNSKLSIATAKVGTRAECPACQASLVVPKQSSLPPKIVKNASSKIVEQARGEGDEVTRKVDSVEKKASKVAVSQPSTFPDEVDADPIAQSDSSGKEPTDVRDKSKDDAPKEAFDSPEIIRIQTDSHADTDSDARSGESTDEDAKAGSANTPFDEFAVYDEPILVVDQEQPHSAPKNVRVDHDRLAVPRRVVYMQGALLGLASLLFFSLGWWLGNSGASNSRADANAICEVTGEILYESGDGQLTDEGAVVLFLPIVDRRPHARPNATELMPGNVLTSRNDSVQIIRELGGDVGSVSGTGKFSIRLKSNRSYYMCVLSANKAGDASDDLSKQQRGEIGTFFHPAESLVNKQDFHWEKVELSSKQRAMGAIVF